MGNQTCTQKLMSQHQKFELSVPVSEIDHTLGPAHAPVTLVEYGDFECPICKQAAPAVKLMLKHFSGKLRVVFRHFPQEEVHPHALQAALAAEAAGGQGKFWLMHDLLFENQSHLKPQHLRSYAEQLELDMVRFDADMEDELYLQRIREHIDGGMLSGVRATPTFFINGRIHDASFGMQSLMDGIDAALHTVPPSHK
jgi:protein-disulfide isomerase